ncbi:MAG: hypothetical protein GY941_30985 [Planctomycetes bacterium]|nr:hypothetical protein [Planctomycetota bacterium]
MENCEAGTTIARSFIIPVMDNSQKGPYNIMTLLDDLENIQGEVICIFNNKKTYGELHKHPRINKYCYNNVNAGISRSWNIGINLSEGRTLFILNPNMHILHSAIEQLETYLFSLDKAVIVGPQGTHVDYHTLQDQRCFRKRTFNKPVKVHAVSGFFFAVNRERFCMHSLMFDVQLSPCFFDELDIGLQIMLAGLACYAVPVEGFEYQGEVLQDLNLSINYFGAQMARSDILSKGKERFKAKWHDAIYCKK